VERRRIAADLHDGVVQELTGVSYALAAAARDPVADAAEAARQAAHQLRQGVRSLRSLLVEIYPPNLAEEGLAAALDDLLARHRARGLDVELDVDLPRDVPLAVAGLAYRVAQEALRNVMHHARAGRVLVTASRDDGELRLAIQDDGRGFDVEAVAAGSEGHLGLRILEDMVQDQGGALEVRSSPGRGTTVELRSPWR
jgi:signal transduction histidine kinase